MPSSLCAFSLSPSTCSNTRCMVSRSTSSRSVHGSAVAAHCAARLGAQLVLPCANRTFSTMRSRTSCNSANSKRLDDEIVGTQTHRLDGAGNGSVGAHQRNFGERQSASSPRPATPGRSDRPAADRPASHPENVCPIAPKPRRRSAPESTPIPSSAPGWRRDCRYAPADRPRSADGMGVDSDMHLLLRRGNFVDHLKQ